MPTIHPLNPTVGSEECLSADRAMPDVDKLFEKAKKYLQKQKFDSALETYREARALYRKARAGAQLIACMEHIVKLAPEDLEANVELAESASRANQMKLATQAFLQASQLAHQAGQEDRWAELAERAHTLDPADPAASIAAAQVYLERGKAAEAIELLRPLADSQPDNLTILNLLAHGYLAIR